MPVYQQAETLRKEKGKHAAEPGFLKPPHTATSASEALSEGSVFRNHQRRPRPVVPCAVQTHSEGRSLPQRPCSTNRDDRGNVVGDLETSCSARGCTAGCGRHRQNPGILISSPETCSFSPTTTFCRSRAYGVLVALQIILYDSVFLTGGNFTCRHTPCWTPRDSFSLLVPAQFGGCSAETRWSSEQKFDIQGKGKDGLALVKSGCWNTFMSCSTKSKNSLS